MSIEPGRLEVSLRDRFGGTIGAARVVVRQAVDLADSGRYREDAGVELTNEIVLDELADAPDGNPPDRWNWWMGALDIAYGGYQQFGIQRYRK